MSAQIKMISTVLILCLIGGGIAAYKSQELGVPFWQNQRVDEWLIEAKLSFAATGKDIDASLALPSGALQQGAGQESGSLGYSYDVKSDLNEHTAQWSGIARDGPQALYYRVRFNANAQNSAEPIPSAGKPEVPEIPSLPGSYGKAAKDLVSRAKSLTNNHDALFVMFFKQINNSEATQEYGLVKRYYEKEKIPNPDITMGIDLLGMAGVQAHIAYGVILNEEIGAQKPLPLVEYFDGDSWIVRNPLEPSKVLDGRKIFVWHRGGGSLYDVSGGGENSRVTFTATKNRISLTELTDISDSPFLISTILALPASEQSIFRYIVLIPLGAFVVVLMRNIVGISTLGTFMPVLLALALLEIQLVKGILMFSILVGAGLWFRFLLSRMNLLVVPRVAACVVIVTLLMILMSVISYKLGFGVGIQITLFPMIIIAWTLERMSLTWEEEGKRSAIIQVSGSVVVAVLAYGFMKISQIQYWAFYFPEMLLILLAGIILIGRYTGYRLSELIRFKTFKNA